MPMLLSVWLFSEHGIILIFPALWKFHFFLGGTDFIHVAMKFSFILCDYSKPVEPERLFDCLPNSMRLYSGSPGHEGDPSGKNPSSNHHFEPHNSNTKADAVVYTPPALLPPRILPLLHDLAQQMFEAGHQRQLLKIYR